MLDTLLTDVSGIHTQVDINTDDIEQLEHRNSEFTDTINNVRGFNRDFY